MGNPYVHLRERDDQAPAPIAPTGALFQHPRTPGVLWDALGWNDEVVENIEADLEKGAWRRDWRRPTGTGKAA